jgi:holin-like protein
VVQNKSMLNFARGTALLIGFLLLGQWTHRLGCPIPGGVAGLLLLFLALNFKIVPLSWVEKAADYFLHHMVLLFVPVTVGLMDAGGMLKQSGVALVVTLFVSFVVTLTATGLLARWLLPYDANSGADVSGEIRQTLEEQP